MKRRRSRPLLGATAVLHVLILVGCWPSCTGFVPVPTISNRGSTVVEEQVLDDCSAIVHIPHYDEDLLRNNFEKSSSYPPWLSRFSAVSVRQFQQDLEWLAFSLRETTSLSPSEIEELRAVVENVEAKEGTAVGAGVVAFLSLTIRYFSDFTILLACVVHYVECIAARQVLMDQDALVVHKSFSIIPVPECDPPFRATEDAAKLDQQRQSNVAPSVVLLKKAAARIKRAELLSHAVLQKSPLTAEQADRMRGLYLSVMEDWRALAIRCIACLYRLQAGGALVRSNPEHVRVAKEAIRIYAPLAQQMNLKTLKSQLEQTAFEILYTRQYNAASALIQTQQGTMHAMAHALQSQMSMYLRDQPSLMDQLEDFTISCRVKEPFSFWKKLLKQRVKQLKASPENDTSGNLMLKSELSVTDVLDGVALRVVLRARKLSPDESDDVTRAREKLLCYYVQELIRSKWPNSSRFKDYIRFPKENGYQSLHHTSFVTVAEKDFPFEVQIRTEEMHHAAEFGPAAHWDYKLGATKKSQQLLPPAAVPPKIATTASASSIATTVSPSNSYLDALIMAKENIIKKQVYVFLAEASNEGHLVSLPLNARVEDALAEVELNREALVVWKNGRLATKQERVENGDVMVVTR